jgi:2-octaprenyl-6-methoxyphenol hydroxylase
MSGPSTDRFDIAIVGGGMVGASLALALSGSPLRIVVIEAVSPDSESQPSFDERTTALGNGARRILETLGVWGAIEPYAAAIEAIHVTEAGHIGMARLRAREHGVPAFGYTVSNRHIGHALRTALKAQPGVTLLSPVRVQQAVLDSSIAQLQLTDATGTARQLEARLVVAADGAHSLIKQAADIPSKSTSYEQTAVGANVITDHGAHGMAYERFGGAGPVAVLPRYDGSYAVIWSVAPQMASALRDCSEHEFCRELQAAFGWRAGRFLKAGRRATYPLALVSAEASIGERVALIGNAAQALHPVAAQGFNLGLRDAATLAELVSGAEDPGSTALLQRFAEQRRADRAGMIRFTDQLVRVFGSHRAVTVVARNLGLLLFDLSPPAKQALSRLSWGFGGTLPRLSRGLPLRS